VKTSECDAPASPSQADANVLFTLKLSPNAAINHEENEGETHYYLREAPHSMQHNSLHLCDKERIKYDISAFV
jgi:hypothetical protein